MAQSLCRVQCGALRQTERSLGVWPRGTEPALRVQRLAVLRAPDLVLLVQSFICVTPSLLHILRPCANRAQPSSPVGA